MKKAQKTAVYVVMDDEQAQAVGLMISQWAWYEHLLNQTIAALLRLPEFSSRKRNIRMTFDGRMQIWEEMARQLHPSDPAKSLVMDIISRTKTARGMRDQIAHGVRWALSSRIDVYTHANQDLRATKTRVVLSAKRVMDLRHEIGTLCYELPTFYQRYLLSREKLVQII